MKKQTLVVQSISRPIWESAPHFPRNAHVLAIFERSLDIALNGNVIALVEPDLKNGPFHIVVSHIPEWSQPNDVDVSTQKDAWSFGSWILDMSLPPRIWEPRLQWEIMVWSQTSLSRLRAFAIEIALRRKGDTPFAQALDGNPPESLSALRQALQDCSTQRVRAAVSKIAGLGPGLTPSGDDFLAGLMLSAHAFGYPSRELVHRLCTIIFETAAPHTTKLSQAFLKAARDGMAHEYWHILLHSLVSDDVQAVLSAASRVLAFGETSGLDMLAGFLWMSETAFDSHLSSIEPDCLND